MVILASEPDAMLSVWLHCVFVFLAKSIKTVPKTMIFYPMKLDGIDPSLSLVFSILIYELQQMLTLLFIVGVTQKLALDSSGK